MDESTRNDKIDQLTEVVEETVKRKILTLRDFEWLRLAIFERSGELISISTLKRIWKYMPRGEVRTGSLNIVARFAGYASWTTFAESEHNIRRSIPATLSPQRRSM